MSLDKRSSADTIYYGKTFHNYGRDWVLIGLRDFVPTDLIVKVIAKNIPDTSLPSNWETLSKEQIVNFLMKIYDKAPSDSKARLEKWVYAHRFRRKVQHEYPLLKRLEDFYMYLRTNPSYKIPVPPDVATKVAAQLTLSGIEKLSEVKSVLKVTICKKQSDWDVFDSLFNKWFSSTIGAYGGRPIIISPSDKFLHFNEENLSVEEALKKLRKVAIDTDALHTTYGPDATLLGGPLSEEETDESGEPTKEPAEENEDILDSQHNKLNNIFEDLIISSLEKGPLNLNDLKSQVISSAYEELIK